MSFFQAIVLAFIQGLTEFLPISSSAHLILVPALTGWTDQGLIFDVAVHVGTLVAVVGYFRKELKMLASNFLAAPLMRSHEAQVDQGARLVWLIGVATLPIVIVGALGKEWINAHLRQEIIIALASILFGVLLWRADAIKKERYSWQELTIGMAVIIGMAQVLALVPGTSRSGITITAALLIGMKAKDAARLSFLLSIPTIAGAALLMLVEVVQMPTSSIPWAALMIGMIVSGVVAYLTIAWFMRIVNVLGMFPFMVYRVLLGLIIIIVYLV